MLVLNLFFYYSTYQVGIPTVGLAQDQMEASIVDMDFNDQKFKLRMKAFQEKAGVLNFKEYQKWDWKELNLNFRILY